MMSEQATTGRAGLSAHDIATFHNDGAVLIRGLISKTWRSVMSEVAEEERALAADNANYYGEEKDAGSTLVADSMFLRNPSMRRFLEESPIAEAAAQGMGSATARIYEDLLLYKSGESGPTPWHQDEPQWPVTGTQLSSIWFSLDATTPETGALQFIAGSHKGPLYIPYMPEERRADLEADMAHFAGGPLPNIAAEPGRFPVRQFSTEPGDAILFHPRAIHAAYGYRLDWPRRTFTIRFLGEDVLWLPKKSVYHDWLKAIDLPAGAPVEHERFPRLWPAGNVTA